MMAARRAKRRRRILRIEEPLLIRVTTHQLLVLLAKISSGVDASTYYHYTAISSYSAGKSFKAFILHTGLYGVRRLFGALAKT
jgi:hypothetical protein